MPRRNTLYIALEGEGSIDGEPFQAGRGVGNASGLGAIEISSPEAAVLIAS